MSQPPARSHPKKNPLAAARKRKLQALLHKRAHPSTSKKDKVRRKKSSVPSSISKEVKAGNLPWKTITPALLSGPGDLSFDAEGGMMELEEVEGVEVVYEDANTEGGRKRVSFRVSPSFTALIFQVHPTESFCRCAKHQR
jgi:hypothetical protein